MTFKIWKIKLIPLVIFLGLVSLGSVIFIQLAMTHYRFPNPQAILVLGGNKQRFEFAAQFSHLYPELDILVSDYSINFKENRKIFQQAGVSDKKVYYDFCPTDTVTNFTCSVDYLSQRNIQHIYVITSDYHIGRSRAIATVVLGSRSITFTTVSVPDQRKYKESNIRIVRDIIRSVIWILTGRTGASFKDHLNQ